jgi:hypothetical protein
LKGRFNENEAGALSDPDSVNEIARGLYYKEVQSLIEVLNKDVGPERPRLYAPDLKFRRNIGEYQGKRFSVNGEALDQTAYEAHLAAVLPSAVERAALKKLAKEPDWIAAN